jgi:hypothetical protein
MSPLCRLTALAAALAPDRASRLIGLVSGATPDAVARAAALADRSREERLAALAATLPPAVPVHPSAGVAAHPLWRRLGHERAGR